MTILLSTVLTLCALGILAAMILYFVAQKFKVEEDPRIDEVEKMLPGANCGGCGFAGCRSMSEALVKNDDIATLYCPVAGGDVMKSIAGYLGKCGSCPTWRANAVPNRPSGRRPNGAASLTTC